MSDCVGHRIKNSIVLYDKLPIIYDDLKFREKYKSSKGERLCIVKFGQRKLLLTLLQFLTICVKKYKKKYDKGKLIVLYIGAGDGTNIYAISKMFPKMKFILYDDHFDDILKKRPNVEIHTKLFFIENAEQYVKDGKNILFLSDIRTNLIVKDEPTEFDIYNNSLLQLSWIIKIKPLMSHLKFRCLFVDKNWDLDDTTYNLHKEIFKDTLTKDELIKQLKKKIKYNIGTIFLQPWTGPSSSETRLVIERDEIGKFKEYDNVEYEDKIYSFNKMKHTSLYKDTKCDNLCDCYDCNLEADIIKKYIELFDKDEKLFCKYSYYFNFILKIKYKDFKLKNKNFFDKDLIKSLKQTDDVYKHRIHNLLIKKFLSKSGKDEKWVENDFNVLFI